MASLSTEISVWLVKKARSPRKICVRKGLLHSIQGRGQCFGLRSCICLRRGRIGNENDYPQSSRIHNWALLKPALLSVGLRFDADQIRNIISGDTKTATRLMTSLAKVQQRNSSGMSNRVKARRGASAFTSKTC